MFTIKHIDKNNTEQLIEAVSVWYQSNAEELAGTDKPVRQVLHYTVGPLIDGGRLSRSLDFGEVYVMNSNGKTVAKYNLGAFS